MSNELNNKSIKFSNYDKIKELTMTNSLVRAHWKNMLCDSNCTYSIMLEKLVLDLCKRSDELFCQVVSLIENTPTKVFKPTHMGL